MSLSNDIVVDTFTESKSTVTESFAELHQFYLQKSPDKPIIHTYAEPCSSEDGPDWKWFNRINQERELERYPHKTYIHPDAGWFEDGYYQDICCLEKGILERISPLQVGDTYPAIIYRHDQTILTVARVIEDLIHKVNLWIYYPADSGILEDFHKHPID